MLVKTACSIFIHSVSIMFKPWIGENYEQQQTPRTLILGESHYVDSYVTGTQPLENKTIANIKDQTINAWPSRFHTKVVATMIGHLPSLAEKKLFWNSVAYHNLITEPLSASRVRPTDEQWNKSVPTLDTVFEKLKPDYCICLGRRMWGVLKHQLKQTPINITSEIGPCGAFRSERFNCIFHGMIHPSGRGFRWAEWHNYITNLRQAQWGNDISSIRT
jgi:hypothetical protein